MQWNNEFNQNFNDNKFNVIELHLDDLNFRACSTLWWVNWQWVPQWPLDYWMHLALPVFRLALEQPHISTASHSSLVIK